MWYENEDLDKVRDVRVYKVWTVFFPGTIKWVKYYVVNVKTHKVQSVWDSVEEANKTAMDLNATYWRFNKWSRK